MNVTITDMPIGKIADNLYHVGVNHAPSYLLIYENELVLIDTAFPDCAGRIIEKIRSLGYDPKNIRHIIHTHGHIDHIGSTKALLSYCDALTYIGKGDEDAVEGKNDLTYAGEYHMDYAGAFQPDVIVQDGHALNVAGSVIRFKATPGHTRGTMSLFFPVSVNGKPYRAGMFGGAGLNTLTAAYLKAHRLPFTLRDDYLHSLEALKREEVTFHVGNHLSDNGYYEKINGGVQLFAEDNTYYRFLDRKKREAQELFAKDI